MRANLSHTLSASDRGPLCLRLSGLHPHSLQYNCYPRGSVERARVLLNPPAINGTARVPRAHKSLGR